MKKFIHLTRDVLAIIILISIAVALHTTLLSEHKTLSKQSSKTSQSSLQEYPGNKANNNWVNARVMSVTDGDTIRVITERGEELAVRLLGIDAPETESSPRAAARGEPDCLSHESKQALTDLVLGKIVKLETDDSQDKYDKYGRLLAYIHINDKNINQEMILSGLAREFTYKRRAYKYQKQFKSAQQQAKYAHSGLWSPGVCQ